MSTPSTARRGVWAGEVGMLLAIVGTLVAPRHRDYQWIAIGAGARFDYRRAAGLGTHDGRAAADGAEPRVWRVCVTLVGTSEFYLRAPHVPPFMMSVLSMEVILGSLTFTGSLMAAGKLQEILPQRPITYKGQNLVNFRVLANGGGWRRYSGACIPSHTHLFPADAGNSAGFRRADDYAHWRRRHADRDFAAEFLCGAFGRGDGFRAG